MTRAKVLLTKAPTLSQVLARVGSFSAYRRGLAIDSLFEGGRMTVGAISVSYLLSTGLPVSHIAYLKLIQSIVLLAGELPTGLFADRYGHRKSLIAASICTMVGLLLFATSNHLILFALAEILTALALCFWSGAYEAFVIDSAQLKDSKGLMDQYFHQNQSMNSLSVLIWGWVGGLVASVDGRISYLLGIILIGISLYLLLKSPVHAPNPSAAKPGDQVRHWLHHLTDQLKETYQMSLQNPILWPFFLVNILIQFSIQPLLHYWQLAFQELTGGGSSTLLGTVFATYCACSFLLSLGFSRVSCRPWARSPLITIILFGLFSGLYFMFSQSVRFETALLIFAMLQGLLSLARTSLHVRLNEQIPQQNRASVLSSISLVSRLGMMGALLLVGQLFKEGQSIFPVLQVFSYGTAAALAIVTAGILYRTIRIRKRKV